MFTCIDVAAYIVEIYKLQKIRNWLWNLHAFGLRPLAIKFETTR